MLSVEGLQYCFTPASPLITSNTVDVFVSGALSSSIVSPLVTGSLISSSVFDSSNEKFLYVIYPNNGNATEQIQLHTNPIVFPPDIEHEFQDDVGVITSESVLVFPNNLDISVTSSNDRFSFDGSGTLTDNPANGTASIFITNPNNYSNVITSSLITLTIVDKEVGEGFLVLKTSMSVIPAPPADMTGDFGSFTILGHPAGKQNRFYTGSLVSESLINYSESKGPINPGFGSYTGPDGKLVKRGLTLDAATDLANEILNNGDMIDGRSIFEVGRGRHIPAAHKKRVFGLIKFYFF